VPTNLDWITNDTAVLVTETKSTNDVSHREEGLLDVNSDLGPNPRETRATMKQQDSECPFGFMTNDPKGEVSPEDLVLQEELKEAIGKSKNRKSISVAWPAVSEKPVNEFSSKKIFALAFPWLFPGGNGDVKDFYSTDIKKWGDTLLRFKDGRFQKDKFFCFFALNYITRHRNAASGNWFIKDFNKGGPQTLEDLKEKIRD